MEAQRLAGELRRDGAATGCGAATAADMTPFQQRLLALLPTTATGGAIPEGPRTSVVSERFFLLKTF